MIVSPNSANSEPTVLAVLCASFNAVAAVLTIAQVKEVVQTFALLSGGVVSVILAVRLWGLWRRERSAARLLERLRTTKKNLCPSQDCPVLAEINRELDTLERKR